MDIHIPLFHQRSSDIRLKLSIMQDKTHRDGFQMRSYKSFKLDETYRRPKTQQEKHLKQLNMWLKRVQMPEAF